MSNINSNISYTNKDFTAIYDELLELVPQLTDKWDPNQSNESDPGNVLLKLNALIADKNNYNIDKNVLELFPASVTQRGNAESLYELLGYKMRWYRAATCDISITCKSAIKESLEDSTSTVKLDAYTTMFTDENKEVSYVLVKDFLLPVDGKPYKLSNSNNYLIEGICKDLEVAGSTTITLDNLDADLRVYFVEKRVAENGIFVSNSSSNEMWIPVDNLASSQLGRKVFKFGVTPKDNTCYIQFPEDIAELIGDGIEVKYIVCTGAIGRIKARQLTALKNDITVKGADDTTVKLNDYITVVNSYASTGGYDPETMAEAYKSYKKVAGTFNTLVTARDYNNALYNAQIDNEPLVSNGVATDCVTGYDGYTVKVKRLDGVEQETALKGTPDRNAIKLYPLDYIDNIDSDKKYNATFKVTNLTRLSVNSYFEDDDTLSMAPYDVKCVTSGDYIYKAYYPLTGRIVTYNKVTEEEATEIENNVKLAVFNLLQARNVEFGQPVDYDAILETAEEADPRISRVILGDIDYDVIKKCTVSGDELEEAELNDDAKKDVYTRSVLAGVTPYCTFDDTFTYKTGYQYNLIEDVISLSPSVKIFANQEHQLLENEYVYAYAPNYQATTHYTNNVYYKSNVAVSAETYYRLQASDKIEIYEKSDQLVPTAILSAGSIIYSTIALKNNSSETKLQDTIKPGQQLDLVQKVEINLTESINKETQQFKCYWVTNEVVTVNDKKDYVLFNENVKERLLMPNEYFIYTNIDEDVISVVGSGTLISRDSTEQWTVEVIDGSDINDIASSVQSQWYVTKAADNVVITENQLVILGRSSVVKAKFDISSTPSELTNESDFEYKESSSDTTPSKLTSMVNVSPNWKVFSALSVNATQYKPIKIYKKANEYEQAITYGASKTELSYDSAYYPNVIISSIGNNIDLTSAINEKGQTVKVNLLQETIGGFSAPEERDNYYVITGSAKKFTIKLNNLTYHDAIVPYFVQSGSGTIKEGNSTPTTIKQKDYAYFLTLTPSEVTTNGISVTWTPSTGAEIRVSKYIYLGSRATNAANFNTEIYSEAANFDYTYDVGNDYIEDVTTPEAFLEVEHPYNKFTIPQLDTSRYNITVGKASKVK